MRSIMLVYYIKFPGVEPIVFSVATLAEFTSIVQELSMKYEHPVEWIIRRD